MYRITDEIVGAKKIVIVGHVRPDGDCIGSCTALYQYLMNIKDELQIESIDVYMEPFGNNFDLISGVEDIKHSFESDEVYDVFISLDCSSLDRLGHGLKYFNTAKKTINIDHHISNTLFADINHVVADASSTCEVIYELLDEDQITKEIAASIYIGIIHDTGVFKHNNTSRKTLEIAGKLIDKGIAFSRLIDESFYQKTYIQNQLMGRCLMESFLVLGNRVIISSVDRRILEFYKASPTDLDGVIDQFRVTKGVEVAIFIYELATQEYKVSLRSNGDVDVSKIAIYFGGGGHIKAAGCTMRGSLHDVINNLIPHVETQLNTIYGNSLIVDIKGS